MIMAYGLAMLRPAMSGAEPWVACAIAWRSPTHSPGARPSPPTRPAPISVRMSPNWLVVTTTSKRCGSITSFVAFEEMMIDSIAMKLVMDPQRFDVGVTTNQFGDILTDIGAGLVGGLGLAP